MALILAESEGAAQWVMGQKGIEMANLNDRTNAAGLGKNHLWRGSLLPLGRAADLALRYRKAGACCAVRREQAPSPQFY
ncbi:transposase [Pseudomonas serboccidentalis]